MSLTRTSVLLAGALGLALASLPTMATPGGGAPRDRPTPDGSNGNRGGDRNTPPGQGTTPPGRGTPPSPPGLGGNPPPGHGGPSPGRGAPTVPRGDEGVCGTDGPTAIGPSGQAGGSHVAHVAFESGDADADAAWARMMYFWIGSSFDFVVNAHGLASASAWTLVAHGADGSAICLAEGVANAGGQLHLAESLELDSNLPEDLDPFAPTPGGEAPVGATLELIASASVDCDAGSLAQDATGSLRSEHPLRFVDVEELTCPE